MDLETTKDAFENLVEKMDNDRLAEFFKWIESRYLVAHCRGHQPAEASRKLQDIATDIRELVPQTAVMPSENLHTPSKGENADCDPRHTVHVDGFLFDDMDIDDLVEEGTLQRNYCKDCHSHNTAPLTYVTHSVSRDRLDFIFSSLLPYLEGKTILDVGSRLGSMLYGAYLYTPARKIIGVEMNADLCEVQKKIIEKHGFSDRIKVICNDIRKVPEIIQSADVVILNNVFEFFLQEQEQISCWQFLKKYIKSGTILVTIPSLETSLKHLKSGIDIRLWVKKRQITDVLVAYTAQEQDELSEVVCYDVIG